LTESGDEEGMKMEDLLKADEELPKPGLVGLAMFFSFKRSVQKRVGEAWEQVAVDAMRRFLRFLEAEEGVKAEGLEDVLELGAKYRFIEDFHREDNCVTVTGALRTSHVEDIVAIAKALVLEGLSREGVNVTRLEEEVDEGRIRICWETR
jgi:formylmethanofuran:tetrahydromethanopterin formyltransferase